MTMLDLPHVGYWNTDRIVRVTAHRARWTHSDFKPFVRRAWFMPWGKPIRIRDHWSWCMPASIRVWTGSGYSDYVEYECKPGQPVLWRDEVLAAIQAARDVGPERIVAAAVLRYDENRSLAVQDEKVYVAMTYTMPAPARHPNILHSMPEDPTPLGGVHDCIQGFLTSTGRFVGRKEAMGIAVAAGQVPASKVTAPDLFSEDVW